jgi:predicted ATPase
VIASVVFRNFKALRNTSLALAPFNLIVGPNGSGKTSLIQAVLHLRSLSKLPIKDSHGTIPPIASPEIGFRFSAPFADLHVEMACSSDFVCDLLKVRSPSPDLWPRAKGEILRYRSFLFDHYAIAEPVPVEQGGELVGNAANLSAVLARYREQDRPVYDRIEAEFCRLLPEFSGLELVKTSSGAISFVARLGDGNERVPASNMSQGTLYTLAILALTLDPAPPSVVCIEEVDRGIHPRLLREIRDAFYRLSYPESFGEKRAPVQVLATTHSPYLLDLFRDHPEEVVIAQKEGHEARFERLVDRPDIEDLLREGPLGDIWFSGILGGVPDEKLPD